jgi:amino acid transporter
MVPEALGKVTDRTASPSNATLLTVAVAEVIMLLQAFFGLPFINYIALFSVCFLIAGIAAIAFPYRRPDLFQVSPGLVRRRFAGVPVLVLAGVGNTLLFSIVLYSCFTNPGLSGVSGWLPVAVVASIYGTGLVIYAIARHRARSAGIDLQKLFRTIPPE